MPWVPLAIAGVEAGTGVAQLIAANKAKKRAHIPSTVDSRTNEYDAELNNMRANLSTGAAYRGFIDSLDKERAATTQAITKSTGGYYGAAVGAAGRLNDTYGESLSKFGQSALGLQSDYMQLHGGVVKDMAARKYNIEEQNYLQNESDYKTQQQSGIGNLFAALESAAGTKIGGSGGGGTGDVSGLIEKTAYDELPQTPTANASSITDPTKQAVPDPFANNFYNPSKFGSDFMKKKKYSLSY